MKTLNPTTRTIIQRATPLLLCILFLSLVACGKASKDDGAAHATKVQVRDSNYRVLGFHLSNNENRIDQYRFNEMSDVAYFSYMLDPSSGLEKSPFYWDTTALIPKAKNAGCQVFLTINNFGSDNNREFLTNPKARSKLLNRIKQLLLAKKANGVIFDFEGLDVSERDLYSDFVSDARKVLVAPLEIAITLRAVDYATAYDIKALDAFADFFVVMGYNYYGGFSKVAGPIAPLKSSHRWGAASVETSMMCYRRLGIDPKKLVLGVPYYGNFWETESLGIRSKVVRFIGAADYAYALMWADTAGIAPKIDTASQSAVLAFQHDSKFYQIWFENPASLKFKYDWVKDKNYAGISIWALGYDTGHQTLWNLLEKEWSHSKSLLSEHGDES